VAIKDLRDNLKRLKDADPVELASQVNGWIQESGEAIRLRVEDEVEKAVTKRGFVKRSEFQKLEARIAALEGKPKRNVKKSTAKSAPKSSVKKSGRKSVKKSVKTNAKGKK
jgi:BMFP domain-containing protein YqiC